MQVLDWWEIYIIIYRYWPLNQDFPYIIQQVLFLESNYKGHINGYSSTTSEASFNGLLLEKDMAQNWSLYSCKCSSYTEVDIAKVYCKF